MRTAVTSGAALGILGVIALAAVVAGCGADALPWTDATTGPADVGLTLDDLRGTITYSSDVDGNHDVYVLRLDGSKPRRLTDDPAREFDPAISPDGTRIAYRMNPDPGRDDADIWIVDIDGTDRHDLTGAPQWSNWAPTWTPDGARIAFTSTRGSGTLELWTMLPDGSDVRQVADGWCEYAAPAPDGSAFVCSAASGGTYDLVVVDAASGERRPLTTSPQTEFGAAWSPDGRWIVFSRDLGERWALMRIRPDGSDEHEIAHEGVFATWDPDGHLAWIGPGGINVAQADGSGRIVLDVPAQFLSWGP